MVLASCSYLVRGFESLLRIFSYKLLQNILHLLIFKVGVFFY
ncbi:hypothetical protein [Staphylococcus phage vB_SauM-V1SA19]|nr:hypothetical protein [Staphylococcus phage vB_SauM-V1SA19]